MDCESDQPCQNSTRRANLCLVFKTGNCMGSFLTAMMFRHGRSYSNQTVENVCLGIDPEKVQYNETGLALIAVKDDVFTGYFSKLSESDIMAAGHKAEVRGHVFFPMFTAFVIKLMFRGKIIQ